MKLMLTLFACLVALATAAPALAGNGQSVTDSVGAVQVHSTSVDPAVSVAAPVAASAPVCVAGACSTSQSGQQADSGASTTSGGQSRPVGQKVSRSVGAVQLDSTYASPAASIAAPIGAAAPVCVVSRCATDESGSGAGSSTSTTSGRQSQPAGQKVSESVGAAQVGSTNVSPAASAAAPVGVFAPVCVASRCSAGEAVGHAGSGSTSAVGGAQGQTAGLQTTQSPTAAQNAMGAKASGAKGGAENRSAGNGPRSGLFAPISGPHARGSGRSAAGGRAGNERHAAHPNGCGFSGVSAKLNSRPVAAGFLPSGGHSLMFLLAIACGLCVFSSLSQWVGARARWWKG